MIPVLFKIGPVPINSYGLMLVIGFLTAYWLLEREFKRRGMPVDFASTEITLGMIGAIVGSRLFHIFEHMEDYSLSDPARFFTGSGFSWYGGFVMAAILILWFGYKKGIRWTELCDASSPAIAIGYGIGRIGCFLSGDGCYGLPCSELGLNLPIPFCMSFPKGSVPTDEIVFNTPILETMGALFIFGYLMLVRKRVTAPAGIFARFIALHGVFRFTFELVRQNPKIALGLTQAQWVSLAIISVGILLLIYPPKAPVEKTAKSRKSGKRKQ